MKRSGFTLIEILVLAVFVLQVGSYLVNAYKATQCDWSNATSWKCEVIHSSGVLVPPAALVTAWFPAE